MHGRQHARRRRIRNLHVEDRTRGRCLERVLDERGLSNATATGEASEEPAVPAQYLPEPLQLLPAAVESPAHGAPVI